MKHFLKIKSEYFEKVVSGRKTFELRKNDRDYQTGDILFLREIDKNDSKLLTGRYIKVSVKYILKHEIPGFKAIDGLFLEYCIMSIEKIGSVKKIEYI